MQAPFQASPSLNSTDYKNLRSRAAFEFHKWDLQYEDLSALADFAVMLPNSEWKFLAETAEELAREILIAENAALNHPGCLSKLGLPDSIVEYLKKSKNLNGREPRVIRFDFHATTEGWKISEANTDVPGGFIEASAISKMMCEYQGKGALAADPVERLIDTAMKNLKPGDALGLVHATAFTDDRQVMVHMGNALEKRGVKPVLLSPEQVYCEKDKVLAKSHWFIGQLKAIFRFFPGEWLANLPRNFDWTVFFDAPDCLQMNPETALIAQSKRLPLYWKELKITMPSWEKYLPAVIDPRNLNWKELDSWVLKPALGRVGDAIGIQGVTEPKEMKMIVNKSKKYARYWVAQKRFEAIPLRKDNIDYYPVLGVFTIDGKAAGIYGRIAVKPLINHRSQEIAILVES